MKGQMAATPQVRDGAETWRGRLEWFVKRRVTRGSRTWHLLARARDFWDTRGLVSFRPGFLRSALASYAATHERAFFLQIGANDGVTSDPLFAHVAHRNWSGLLVEPVPHIFERLVRNYAAKSGLLFENAAIADSDGIRPFYRLRQDSEGVPPWAHQLGSFLPEVILSHRVAIPDIERYVVRDDVPCLTLNSLLCKHGVETVDILITDVEGYDHEILKLVDFTHVRPEIILFESVHLKPHDYRFCLRLLRRHGYRVVQDGSDTIAVLRAARDTARRCSRASRDVAPHPTSHRA